MTAACSAVARKRKIIVYLATSADGFIARPDGSVDWLEGPRPKGNYGMGAFYQSIDTVLWGRKTCDMALDFQKKGVTGSPFDTRVKNYVFTRSVLPSPAPERVEFVSEPIKAFATRLWKKKGKDIWMMDGAGIIASFLDQRPTTIKRWVSPITGNQRVLTQGVHSTLASSFVPKYLSRPAFLTRIRC